MLWNEEEWKVKSLSHIWLFATPWTVCLPGSPAHGIFQARVQYWVAISFSRGIFPTQWSNLHCGQILNHWTTREAPLKTFVADLWEGGAHSSIPGLLPWSPMFALGSRDLILWAQATDFPTLGGKYSLPLETQTQEVGSAVQEHESLNKILADSDISGPGSHDWINTQQVCLPISISWEALKNTQVWCNPGKFVFGESGVGLVCEYTDYVDAMWDPISI